MKHSDRRWFTKTGDVEKGPYEPAALKRSYRDGFIKAATLVRAEDEQEWRELASVPELRVPGMPQPLVSVTLPSIEPQSKRDRSPPPEPENRPSFSFWRAIAHVIVAVIVVMIVGVVLAQFSTHERAVHLGRAFSALARLVAMFVFGLSWFLQMKRWRGALLYSGVWLVVLTMIWWFG